MAPLTPPRSATSTAGSAYSHKHTYQSPPPKQPQHGDTPPVPAPPPPPQVIPGPNAFAQHRRAIGTSNRVPSNESDPGGMSSPPQQYTVKMYSDIDPNVASPTFARQGSRLYRMHHRQNSSTDRSQAALGSASSGSAPWSGYQSLFDNPMPYRNQQAAGSRFFDQMKQARERLDTTIEESPQREADAERLKLIPSPDQHSFPYPTHRAELDKRNVERFRDLIANDGSISPNTHIANIHGRPPISTSHKEAKSSSSTSTPKSQRSPKRGILNKLGLGLRMTPPDDNLQSAADYALISSVPPKAAKVLGAKSLPSRNRHAAAASGPDQWPSPDGVSRSPSAPSPKRSSKKSDLAQPSLQTTVEEEPAVQYAPIPTKSPLRRESRRVPKKHQELRYYDDDNPPTPPSKPRPTKATEKQAEADQQERAKDLESKAQEGTNPRRAQSLQASPTPSSAPYTRSGFAGYHSAAVPTTNTPNSNVASVYGSVAESPSSDKSPSANEQSLSPYQQRHSYPDRSPSFKNRTSKQQSTTFLQPMKYDPKSPTAKAKWSVSHLPTTPASTTSRNSLKPGPLRLQTVAARRQRTAHLGEPSHSQQSQQQKQKQQQHSSSGTSSSKSRDVSESTSASVPLFLETHDLSGSVEDEETITATPNEEQAGHVEQANMANSPGGEAATAEEDSNVGEDEADGNEEEPNTITVQVLHEYLVETWSQGETIKESLHSQQETLEDLRETITAGDNEVVEEIDQLLKPIHQDVQSTNEGIVAVKRAQDEHAKEQGKLHAQTDKDVTAVKTQLSSLTSLVTDLKTTIESLNAYIHANLSTAAAAETSTSHTSDATATPQLSTSATTHNTSSSISAADFALLNRSQRSERSESPVRTRSPPKLQTQSRTYPVYERTSSPSKLAIAGSGRPWASERTRGYAVDPSEEVGSSELGMRDTREGTTTGQDGKNVPQEEGMASTLQYEEATTAPSLSKAGVGTPSPRKEGGSATSSEQSTATKTSGDDGQGRSGGGGGGSSFDIRNYLQSVPQSAQTDPGIRGGTWGRKVAREKFERWTG